MKERRKALVLLNRAAGFFWPTADGSFAGQVRDAFRDAGVDAEVVVLSGVELGERARQAARSSADVVAATNRDLAAEWQPRNGIERQLIDTMAQAQESVLFWMHRLTAYTSLESFRDDRMQREMAKWQPPRQSDADAMQQAAEMVDRFNRIFLRTLRALCDLRRNGPKVIVKKGGQLNVAEQQVNVAGSGSG